MIRVSPEDFEALVRKALDSLPDEFAEMLDNVAVVVEESPSDDDLAEVGMTPEERDELLGLYQGVSLPDRDSMYSALPDRVVVYRRSILLACTSRREVIREVRDTVIHELGHYFGMEEDDMPY